MTDRVTSMPTSKKCGHSCCGKGVWGGVEGGRGGELGHLQTTNGPNATYDDDDEGINIGSRAGGAAGCEWMRACHTLRRPKGASGCAHVIPCEGQ